MKLTGKLKQAGKITLPFLFAGILLNPIQAQEKKEKSNDWLYHGLEASYIALNYINYKKTLNAIDNNAIELNPLAKPFVENPHNNITFGLFKAGTTFGFLYYLRKIKEYDPKLAYGLLITGNLFYGHLVYHEYLLDLQFNLNNKK